MRWFAILPASPLVCAQAAPPPADPDPAREFFAKPAVVHVQLTLDDAARQLLRDKPREYARATLQIDEQRFGTVGVKLKGAAGSFRKLDEQPAFTVHLGKFEGVERLHGLLRFHLNNSVQDDTRLCEWLGHQLFDAAGHPAPRVTHARVRLDDRDLGVYVLREGFDKQFLLRVFGTTAGNLYDGGFCRDIDEDLEKDSGDGPDDHGDLHRLRDVCGGVDAHRAAALATAVDLPRFVDFAALEAMVGHWDGYCQNRNNFRLWIPTQGGATFLPHGMDQLFGEPDASVLDHPPGIVASAVMQQPALRKQYRERLRALLPLFAPARLRARFDAVERVLQREFATLGSDAQNAQENAARELWQRVAERHRELEKQVRAPEPKPVALAVGKAMPLRAWRPAAETDGIELAKKDYRGTAALHVQCEAAGADERRGAFRCDLLLAHGRYQLRATARCDGVTVPEHGGAALRVGDAASEVLSGDRNWQALACDLEVGEYQRNVELRLDVHALGGSVWFRLDSLQLVRLPD